MMGAPDNTLIQIRDAANIFDNFVSVVNWNQNDSILDVGTGNGVVLKGVIIPKLEKTFKKLVAIDIDEHMLHCAKKSAESVSNVEFVLMDIAESVVPSRFNQHFEHIFSFNCLHWVSNRRQAFLNLFKMLTPGGDMLLTVIAQSMLCEVIDKLIILDKWAHLKCYVEYMSLMFRSPQEAIREIQEHLEVAGFAKARFDIIDLSYSFQNITEFWNFASEVDPLLPIIPQQSHEAYKENYLEEVMKIAVVKDGHIHTPYKTVVVYAAV